MNAVLDPKNPVAAYFYRRVGIHPSVAPEPLKLEPHKRELIWREDEPPAIEPWNPGMDTARTKRASWASRTTRGATAAAGIARFWLANPSWESSDGAAVN